MTANEGEPLSRSDPPSEPMRFDSKTQRNSYYARKRREDLILLLTKKAWDLLAARARAMHRKLPRALVLGYGRCACCDRDMPCYMMQIDHINGRSWLVEKMNAWRRVARYWREYEDGVPMRVLCLNCNARLGASRRYPRRRR